MIHNFPSFFRPEEGRVVTGKVTLSKIKKALIGLAKDKILCPYGWIVEIFFIFFYLIGKDLLEVVEESRLRGKVVGALNATFIASIPKCDKPLSCNDYRPISLCDVVYNIITKIIANRIKPFSLKMHV